MHGISACTPGIITYHTLLVSSHGYHNFHIENGVATKQDIIPKLHTQILIYVFLCGGYLRAPQLLTNFVGAVDPCSAIPILHAIYELDILK